MDPHTIIGNTYNLDDGTVVTVSHGSHYEPPGSIRLYYRIPLAFGHLTDYQVSTAAKLLQSSPSAVKAMMEMDVFYIKVRHGVTVVQESRGEDPEWTQIQRLAEDGLKKLIEKQKQSGQDDFEHTPTIIRPRYWPGTLPSEGPF